MDFEFTVYESGPWVLQRNWEAPACEVPMIMVISVLFREKKKKEEVGRNLQIWIYIYRCYMGQVLKLYFTLNLALFVAFLDPYTERSQMWTEAQLWKWNVFCRHHLCGYSELSHKVIIEQVLTCSWINPLPQGLTWRLAVFQYLKKGTDS